MNNLSSALKVYLGIPESSYPRSYSDRVAAAFGDQMMMEVEDLISEAGALEVDWKSHSLISAMRWVETEMRLRHSALSNDAVSDLGWAWSYWNK